MMHRVKDDVIVLVQAQQSHAEDRPLLKIKRPLRLLRCQPPRLGFAGNPLCDQLQVRRWSNYLLRHAIHSGKGCAKHLMPAHHLAEAAFECIAVEMTSETNGAENVVSSTLRFYLVQKPEPLLGKREPQGAVAARDPHDGWNSPALA